MHSGYWPLCGNGHSFRNGRHSNPPFSYTPITCYVRIGSLQREFHHARAFLWTEWCAARVFYQLNPSVMLRLGGWVGADPDVVPCRRDPSTGSGRAGLVLQGQGGCLSIPARLGSLACTPPPAALVPLPGSGRTLGLDSAGEPR
jgi:hypothetical protein